VVVVLIDAVSMVVRSAVTEEGDVERPSWSSLFLPASISSAMHPTPMRKDADVHESE
jgi:hypothetical protein